MQSSVASRLLSRLSSIANLSPEDLSDEITVMKGACAVAAEGMIFLIRKMYIHSMFCPSPGGIDTVSYGLKCYISAV